MSYSIFIKYNTNADLLATIPLIIFNFFSSVINNPYLIENSFNQVMKINNFFYCINNINNLEGLSKWTGYLLHNKANIREFENDLLNNNITTEISNIMKSINKPNNDDASLQSIGNNIIKCYNNLDIKFPKLYLLDLIYYVLNYKIINLLINFFNINNNIYIEPIVLLNYIKIDVNYYKRINISDNIIDNDIFDNIFNQLPPSLSSYVYVYLDDKYNMANLFLENKYIESYNLNLLYYGCLCNFMDPFIDVATNNHYFITDFKNVLPINELTNYGKFIFNPDSNIADIAGIAGIGPVAPISFYQDPRLFLDNNVYSTPLPFNYYYNPDDVNKYDKYLKWMPNQYRPASIMTHLFYIKNLIKKLYNLINKLLKDNKISYIKILKNLLTNKQKISQMYYELFIIIKIVVEKINILLIEFEDTIDISKNNNIN